MSTPPPPTNSPRILISHSHIDDAVARRLATRLGRAGAYAWMEITQLRAGERHEVFDHLLAMCDWLVVVETPAALASPWVKLEVNAAYNRVRSGAMRGVFRLVAQPHPADDVSPLWTTLPTYDATTDFDGAVAAILTAIQLDDEREVTQPRSEAAPRATRHSSAPTAAFLEARWLHAHIAAAYTAQTWMDVVDLTYRLLATHPFDVTANDLHMRGRALLELSRPVEADAALSSAYDRDRFDAPIMRDYAQALRALGRLDEAAALYQRALALCGDDETRLATLREYVATVQAQGRWGVALPRIDEALRLRPDDLNWLTLRVAALTELRQANWAMVSLYQDVRATLSRVNAPPELAHWLAVVYAMRAAYPNVAAMAGGGDGGTLDYGADDTTDQEAILRRAAQKALDLLDLVNGPDENPDPELVRHIKRIPEVVEANLNQWKTIYLTVDLSPATGNDALANMQRAAHEFVQTCGLDTTAIGLIGFSDRVEVFQEATHNMRDLANAIARLRAGAAEAHVGEQLFTTLIDLMGEWRGARYGVVVAAEAWGAADDAILAARRCHAAGIGIAAIGLGDADHDWLGKIASSPDMSMRTSDEQLARTLATLAHRLFGA